MKNFSQHIEDLLIKYECVIVPNLGGFIIRKENAFIKGNQFYAPSHKIRFNQLLSYSDGLLIESYMKDRQISYNEALKVIDAETRKIKNDLNCCMPVFLGKIGILSQSEQGTITLKSGNNAFIPDNIGLPVINLHNLAALNSSEVRSVSLHTNTAKKAGHYAAAIILACGLSLLCPHQTNNTADYAAISLESLKNIARTINTDEDSLVSAEPMIFEEDANLEINDSNKAADKYRYHLIIASLNSKKQADKYIETQTTFHAESLKIINSKGRYRIAAKSFQSYQTAIAYRDSIKKENPLKSSWILCQ